MHFRRFRGETTFASQLCENGLEPIFFLTLMARHHAGKLTFISRRDVRRPIDRLVLGKQAFVALTASTKSFNGGICHVYKKKGPSAVSAPLERTSGILKKRSVKIKTSLRNEKQIIGVMHVLP